LLDKQYVKRLQTTM